MKPFLSIFVPGLVKPAGSKRAFPRMGGDGKLHVNVSHDNPGTKRWMSDVRQAAGAIMAGRRLAATGAPVAVELTFRLPRPTGHYGSGKNADRLLPSAPAHPTKKPDLTKLARAVEDGMSKVVWKDDAQIVWQAHRKEWADGTTPGVLVEVLEL